MQQLQTIEDAENKINQDAAKCLQLINALSSQTFETTDEAILILQKLRAEIYEDLNQIQHEYLIIQAVKWLISNQICPVETVWEWNPRQTGTFDEPDLRGTASGAIVLSAEITASPKPLGLVDSRMQKTLGKLANTQGTKYYFVRTREMEQRANTKVRKAGWPITVCLIS